MRTMHPVGLASTRHDSERASSLTGEALMECVARRAATEPSSAATPIRATALLVSLTRSRREAAIAVQEPDTEDTRMTNAPRDDVPRLDTPLLTPAEAADLLSVSVSWIYEA